MFYEGLERVRRGARRTTSPSRCPRPPSGAALAPTRTSAGADDVELLVVGREHEPVGTGHAILLSGSRPGE
jgi:hypothetical protein